MSEVKMKKKINSSEHKERWRKCYLYTAFRDAIFQTVVFKQRNKATQVSRESKTGKRTASPKALSWEWSWHVQ